MTFVKVVWRQFFLTTLTFSPSLAQVEAPDLFSYGFNTLVICVFGIANINSRGALEEGYRGYIETSRQAKSSRLMNRSAILGQSSHILCRGLWFNSRDEVGCGVPLRLVPHRAVLGASAC